MAEIAREIALHFKPNDNHSARQQAVMEILRAAEASIEIGSVQMVVDVTEWGLIAREYVAAGALRPLNVSND